MARYVGGRIVPTHGGVWDGSKSYEELTIVLREDTGDSYISKRAVPATNELRRQNVLPMREPQLRRLYPTRTRLPWSSEWQISK